MKIRKDVASIEIWTKVPSSEKDKIEKLKKWFTDAAGIREDAPIDFTPFYWVSRSATLCDIATLISI